MIKYLFLNQKQPYSIHQKFGFGMMFLGLCIATYNTVYLFFVNQTTSFDPIILLLFVFTSLSISLTRKIDVNGNDILSVLLIAVILGESVFMSKFDSISINSLLLVFGCLLAFRSKAILLIIILVISLFSSTLYRKSIGILDLEISNVDELNQSCDTKLKMNELYYICTDSLVEIKKKNGSDFKNEKDSIVMISSKFLFKDAKFAMPSIYSSDKDVITGGVYSDYLVADMNTAVYFSEKSTNTDRIYSYNKGSLELIWGMDEFTKTIFVLDNNEVIAQFFVSAQKGDLKSKFPLTMPIMPF